MDPHRNQYPMMRPDGRPDLRRPQITIPQELMQNLSLNSHIRVANNPPIHPQVTREILQMRNHLSNIQDSRQMYYQQPVQMPMGQPQNHFRSFVAEPVTQSILSANAAEFVPRGAASFAHNPQPSQQITPQHTIPQWEYVHHPIIQNIDSYVVDLTLKPYKYEEISKQICSILSRVHDPNLMKEVVTLIIEQGIGEANFRYSGAKLCQHLSHNVNYSYEGPKFRELLLRWCQEEYEHREYYMGSNLERVQGFTLFLGDLFTQLKTSTGQSLDPLHEAICRLLETLMLDPTNENNLKCVVKTLKVAGSLLDSTENPLMDRVMFRLKDLTVGAPVSADVKTMLLSTIELRASNWGLCNNSTPQNHLADVPLGTVYYGPDGQIKKVVPDEALESDSEDPFFGSNVEELEGEEAAAFEEFLRSQKNGE